ncbi:MAG: helix-turn-helix domain-containing protein [Reichenbachiella sp.]
MQLELIDLWIAIGVIQGVFLILSLLRVKDRNKKSTKFLILFLSMAIIMLSGRFYLFRASGDWVSKVGLIIDSVIFLFGPMAYLYVKSSTRSNSINKLFLLGHLIPFILFLTYVLHVFLTYTDKEYTELSWSGHLNTTYTIIEVAAIMINLIYSIVIVLFLRGYSQSQSKLFSYKQSLHWYLMYYALGILIIVLFWMISFAGKYFWYYSSDLVNYDTVWISISLLTYVIGYFILVKPDLFRIEEQITVTKSYDRLSKEEVAIVLNKMEAIFNQDKVFRNPELTLKQLADQLDIKPNDLSWLLNKEIDESFYDYINGFRVKDFLKKIQNREHKQYTLLNLATTSGFNTKSTFNKVFKKHTGQTPSAYINALQIETSPNLL